MIPALALALMQAPVAAPPPPVAAQTPPPAAPAPAPAPAPAEPPHDWTGLPVITLGSAGPDMIRFVREEVHAGRCTRASRDGSGQMVLAVPLALRISPDGLVQTVVPLAIDCPTVEQYSAGAAERMMRHLPHRAMLAGDRWYRTAITYTWPG
ncbi:hypothetical protein [Sphingomonas sp.]|uniref:hypothetical protein n=1 Tax=Sphingomonas sp. TaxID=28214 RepID=UPI0031D8ED5B